MSYASGDDALCYPDTGVLRNKAGIQSLKDLEAFELEMVVTRSKEIWPSGQLDTSHYLMLHRHLFQDVYDWAGTLRTIRIGKDGVWFCYPEYIEQEMFALFGWLNSENYFQFASSNEFAGKAARFMSELNAIHPFREGNGRTQMSFSALLVDNAELPFNTLELEPKRAMSAMIDSFRGNLLPLQELIHDLVRQ
ncbi:MAG: Fic/DOC family protein [Rhizobiaceae bacterium]